MELPQDNTDELLLKAGSEEELFKKRGYLNVVSQRLHRMDERQHEIYSRVSYDARNQFYGLFRNGNGHG